MAQLRPLMHVRQSLAPSLRTPYLRRCTPCASITRKSIATTMQAAGKPCFTGQTAKELREWLERAGVPVEGVYGHGLAKTVDELLDEVQKHESVLCLDGNKALRIVNVLSVHVLNSRGQVLFEEEQILPDGRSRKRNVPLSEKMIGEENWHDALKRAVQEELGSALPASYQVTPQEESYFLRTEMSSSMSYPGLLTKYIFHRIRATITGLPDADFQTVEPRPTGQLTTKWGWRVVPQETF